MIAIIDYGMGNLASVRKAFAYLGAESLLTSRPEDIAAADHVVLPGVGAFRDAIAALRETGLGVAFKAATRSGKPCLGICLGMQLLFERSGENGDYEGLSLLPGAIEGLPRPAGIKIPHMGWNDMELRDALMFENISASAPMYFVHSYAYRDVKSPFAAALCVHGEPFVSAVRRETLWGVQFHPEKSGEAGLALLDNFLRQEGGTHA